MNCVFQVVQHFREFMRTYARMLGVPDSKLSAMDDIFELETLMAKVSNRQCLIPVVTLWVKFGHLNLNL